MSNILDYIDWRGDLPFDAFPLNEVDSLLLSVITHIDFDGIVPDSPEKSILLKDAAEIYFKKNNGKPEPIGFIVPDAVFDVLYKMMTAKRFADLSLSYYVDDFDLEKEQQFAAVTYILPNQQGIFIAFRGTDDTLIGWKEDFNMSFMNIVPSQRAAVRYVDNAARIRNGDDIYIGGHSKGGNLAAFGGSFCSGKVQERIRKIYCGDSPGFSKDITEQTLFTAAMEKTVRLLPQTSVVGMLLENPTPMRVVKSNAKGLFQHDPFSWEVMGSGFVCEKALTEECNVIKNTIDQWLMGCSFEQRSEIVNSLYVFLSMTEAKTLTELNNNRSKLMGIIRKLPKETGRNLLQIVKLLTNAEGNKLRSEVRRKFTHGGTE